jgi:hypothetical protein
MYTSIALKKLLKEFLMKKYPSFRDIVITYDHLYDDVHQYQVFIDIVYSDLQELDIDKSVLLNDIREISKYIFGKGETIEQVYFYDSKNQ